MRQTRLLMGMPITVEIVDNGAGAAAFDAVYDHFAAVDARYSTYKPESEISRINHGLPPAQWSDEMKTVLQLCQQTKQQTKGYFDIQRNGYQDPSGLVKGWAIQQAAELLAAQGWRHFYVEAGGDIQAQGFNGNGRSWRVGIRNPFQNGEVVKVLAIGDGGMATSGAYIRGQHIYNPHQPDRPIEDIASVTVVGPDIYDADRWATAAFAMGRDGIGFIESLAGYEGYMIDSGQRATLTSGLGRYMVAA